MHMSKHLLIKAIVHSTTYHTPIVSQRNLNPSPPALSQEVWIRRNEAPQRGRKQPARGIALGTKVHGMLV